MAGGQSFPSPGWSTSGIAVYSMGMCAWREGFSSLPLCLVSLLSPSLAPPLESRVPWGRTQSCSSLALWWPSQDGSKSGSSFSPPFCRKPSRLYFLECELDVSLASLTCKEMRGEGLTPPHLTPIGVRGSQSTAGALSKEISSQTLSLSHCRSRHEAPRGLRVGPRPPPAEF